ncbi:phosphoglycerate kinase [Lichenicoccus roseus]|uniref:Phosphoglycerate kinase n=1 Tax=Lichenicoccus roseus TaxID=2683649 RepID=A0A5R9JCT2_9PROT|nr:phosphoglycerate kinase [Lichenicoccus roseus]TLU73421.1 phosphoglycerate kinase [Lichenicoccus roseus]
MSGDPAVTQAVPEEKKAAFRTIDQLECRGKRVLLRADLNVPVKDGRITDLTRLDRLTPTIRELADKGARVIVVSHFDRPKGVRVPSMSLAPVGEALAGVLGHPVHFAADCIGPEAEAAVSALKDGEVLVLENTRYHPGEEANDPEMARALASLADIYVNDAFSAAHRAHASTEGVARHLPAHAGRLMQAELTALTLALEHPERPVGAIVGGAKVSTKLDLIGNILGRVDVLIIGGAMANTFLAAQGVEVGRSLQEPGMHDTARSILEQAKARGCEILLPVDAVTATEFKANAATRTVPIAEVPVDSMILDCGPETVALLGSRIGSLRTLVWNGPMGAFETPPFDAGTNALARMVASLTEAGTLRSVAGGGDTVSALRHAGVMGKMSYVSTAGGAFLEWLEGKMLPGIQALDALAGIVLPR